MAGKVRYGATDDDVLRSVLLDLYKSRCYWCGKLKDFTNIETDHIIPKRLTGDGLRKALDRVGRAHDFDLNDPENLAPICGRCNGAAVKGNKDMTHLPVVASHLHKAKRLKPEVERRVHAFSNRRKLAGAFVALKAANLNDEDTRRAFEENIPAVMRKLSSAGGDLADFALYRVAGVSVDDGEPLEIALELEGSSKRAAQLLEGLTGVTLEEVVQEPVADLWQQVHSRVQDSFDSLDGDGLGPSNSGPPVAHYFRVDVETVSLDRIGGTFEFTFAGDFEAQLSASVVRDDPYGWDRSLVELQGDASVEGTFTFTATWDAGDDDGAVYAEESMIESWEIDISTSP